MPHPSLRVARLEKATSRAELLENKMAALESESLESKLIQVLTHTHIAVCCSPKPPTLYSLAKSQAEPSWLISLPLNAVERTFSNGADPIWTMQQPATFGLVSFF